MTKKIYLIGVLFVILCNGLNAQQIATSNTMSLEALIQNTLGQGCVEISNITSSINGSVDNISSYGSFTKDNSNFPFENGLVLTTGSVSSAGNVLNTNPLNDGSDSWGTDPDLETALEVSQTLNATSIEFDFISAANGIAFNYLLASEEYFGTNPCRYSDRFVFLIKEVGSSAPYTNIALIPGTSLPVNTTNIRPKIVGFCPAENPMYFEGYNIGDTNYNGRTTVLTASTAIVPNVTYHIKIVIADHLDQGLDSAVFIEGNSFNANVDLGPDINTCASSTILNANINNPMATYEWFRDGNLISGAKNPSLNVTQSGTYKVEVTLPLDATFCKVEDEISVTVNVLQSLSNISDYILCDDSSNDGKAVFDLTTRNEEVLQGLPPSDYSITYHLTSVDAKEGANPIETFENTQNPQDIFIRINDISNNCASLSGVRLVVNPPLAITTPDPLNICDSDGNPDGFTEIDLSEIDSQITSDFTDTSDLFVTYHTNSTDAISGEDPIFSPYTNTSSNQTLYVRLYDSTTGCHATTTLDLTVSKAPKINIERPFINACMQNGAGFGTFDLTSELNIILSGLPGVSASVYETIVDAEGNINAITNTNNYQNLQGTFKLLYVRLVDNLTGCFTIFPWELHSNIAKTGLNFEDFNGCDNTSNGSVDFDLNAVEGQLLDNLEGFDVVFFNNQDDQQNNTNPLNKTNPYTVTSSPTPIYFTATIDGCKEFLSINLVINPPVILPIFDTVEYCDRNQDGTAVIILSTFDNYVSQDIAAPYIQYYRTEDDARDDRNAFGDSFRNRTREQTIYVRVTNLQTSCYDVAPLTIKILDAPEVLEPVFLFNCDADSNGYAVFDLESTISDLVADTSGLTFSFHKNYNLATSGTNAIENPSNFNSHSQFIAVRVENDKGCFGIASIYLVANIPPVMPPISNFQNCTSDGSSIADFYFIEKDDEILNGQTNKEVLYFEDAQDAEDRANMIDKSSAYRHNSAIAKTIYVRVEAFDDPNCYATSSFVLELDNYPTFTEATDEFLCDYLGTDGFTTFDLSVKEAEIRTNASDKITFYRSDDDAKNEANPISNLNFTNTANPQSIFARIDNGSFCYSLTSFSLNVVPKPKADAPSDLYFCNANLSSIAVFDLEVVTILDLRPDEIEITYHESPEDLDLDIQIINPNNYISSSNLQTVYAKIRNTLSQDACFTTLSINLNVVSPPSVNDFKEYPICSTPNNAFDLKTIDSELTSEPNIQITYFSSSNDAIANDLNTALDPNYNYSSSNDRIYVRLQNTITQCTSYYDFELVVNPLPLSNKPDDLEECDDNFDGRLTFDLSAQTSSILGNLSQINHVVTYHQTPEAANNGAPILNNLYNAADGQVIYARVSNTDTGCYSTTEFSVIVNPKPIVNIPDQAICSDNPASSVIVNADTNNPTDTYLWSTGETTSEIEIGTIGSYYVTVTGDFGCQTTQEFDVLEYESATIEAIETIDFSDPNNITITVSGSGDYLYILDDGSPQESNVFENVTLGYHTVTIIDSAGCTNTTKEVVVIDAPKFMTPNNDGYFDTWHISGIETLPGSVINIYDRYGKLLATLNSNSKGWDGTYRGAQMPSSDYWFVGKINKNGNVFEVKGHFSLKL